MKQGRVSSKDGSSEFIGLWVHKELLRLVQLRVRATDTDRSKYIRAAMREKVARELAGAKS